MRVAFATCAAMPEGDADDRPAAALVGATFEVWDDPAVDWAAYDRVVVRSTWDYTDRAKAFVAWCAAVGPERLRNDPGLIAWNSDKRYLAGLPVATVPTTFVGPGDALPELAGEVVVKPNVSAGARDTGRFGPALHDDARALIVAITASGRTALVQPYLPSVDERGETAMVRLGGAPSHVLRKRAVLQPDEIAPLAEGSAITAAAVMYADDLVTAGEAAPDEQALADELLAHLAERFGSNPLFARVDVVRLPDGRPALLELEVVEPCLYLAQAPGAPERFAAAILADAAR